MCDTNGNIQHNVNPVLGWLRLAVHDGKTLTQAQMESAIEKLTNVLNEVQG